MGANKDHPPTGRGISRGPAAEARRVTWLLSVLWLTYVVVTAWALWTMIQSLYRSPIPRWTGVAPLLTGVTAVIPSLAALWRDEVLRGAVVPITAAGLTVAVWLLLWGFTWPGWGILGFMLIGALYVASMRRTGARRGPPNASS